MFFAMKKAQRRRRKINIERNDKKKVRRWCLSHTNDEKKKNLEGVKKNVQKQIERKKMCKSLWKTSNGKLWDNFLAKLPSSLVNGGERLNK